MEGLRFMGASSVAFIGWMRPRSFVEWMPEVLEPFPELRQESRHNRNNWRVVESAAIPSWLPFLGPRSTSYEKDPGRPARNGELTGALFGTGQAPFSGDPGQRGIFRPGTIKPELDPGSV